MVPYDYENLKTIAKKHVVDKKIRMSRIDDAVPRFFWLKFETGLFEEPFIPRCYFISISIIP